MACPYGVRTFNEEQRVVEKCTMCAHLVDSGEEPACVKACCGKARIFGDLSDPASNVSQAIREAGSSNVHVLTDIGNHPSFRYILHRKHATWRSS
jgi:Fe-S-cluster-containing dehydrogenase component